MIYFTCLECGKICNQDEGNEDIQLCWSCLGADDECYLGEED